MTTTIDEQFRNALCLHITAATRATSEDDPQPDSVANFVGRLFSSEMSFGSVDCSRRAVQFWIGYTSPAAASAARRYAAGGEPAVDDYAISGSPPRFSRSRRANEAYVVVAERPHDLKLTAPHKALLP
jgi:hypothetical protein